MNHAGIAFKSNLEDVRIKGATLSSSIWTRIGNVFEVTLKGDSGIVRFAGFTEDDGTYLREFFNKNFNIDMQETLASTKGWNWGKLEIEGINIV